MGALLSLALTILTIPVTTSVILGIVWTWSFVYLNKWDPSYTQLNLSKLIQDNQWYRVVTSPFVHQSPFHAFVNIMALWGCCSRVEIVFGSLFFLKYTLMLMFIEAFGSIFVVQSMVRLFRNRRNLYRSTTQCWLALQRAPQHTRNAITRLTDMVSDSRSRGSYSAFGQNSAFDEEEGGNEGETDRLTGNNNDEDTHSGSGNGGGVNGLEPEFLGDEYEDEYEDEGSSRRTGFASVYDHPLTSEPVMGMSGVILAWLAFIAFQWFLRNTTIGTSDSTVVPPALRHGWGYVHDSIRDSGSATTADSGAIVSVVVDSVTNDTTTTTTTTTTTGNIIGSDAMNGSSGNAAAGVRSAWGMYSRYTMATTPYSLFGFIPIFVALCPPLFMITARLTLQPQILTMSSHVRYMVSNMFMAPCGVLLALEYMNALNDWYWLGCFVFNMVLLLTGSIVENRRVVASGVEFVRPLFGKLDREERDWREMRLEAKKESRKRANASARSVENGNGNGNGDSNQLDNVGASQQQQQQQQQEEEEEEGDFSSDITTGTGLSFALITKNHWDVCSRLVPVYDPLHFSYGEEQGEPGGNSSSSSSSDNRSREVPQNEEEVGLLRGHDANDGEGEDMYDGDDGDADGGIGDVELSRFV